MPEQYQERRAHFYESVFYVDERVLIPRPETEILVETALDMLKTIRARASSGGVALLDLGTGSGNIVISLTLRCRLSPALKGGEDLRHSGSIPSPSISLGAYPEPAEGSKSRSERPGCVEGLTKIAELDTIVACDISADALCVARLNAVLHGLAGKIAFIQSDLFDTITGQFDMIVSNPPYVSSDEFGTLPPEVLQEPAVALDGGPDGLVFIWKIIEAAPGFLKPGGALLMEIGYDQSRDVQALIRQTEGLSLVAVRKDYSNIDRVIVAERHG